MSGLAIRISPTEFVHDVVNKLEGYVRDQVHVNSVENFWCLLKRRV